MAHYLVRANLKQELANELYERLKRREFISIKPFGEALTYSLENAREDLITHEVVWEEEDYCNPPLAMERAMVLDHYFENLRIEPANEGEGWLKIKDLPLLWKDFR